MDIKKPLATAAGAALVGLGAMTALPAVASAAPATAAHAPVYGVWPAQADGRPTALKAGSAPGYYLWHNEDGWRLEVTGPAKSDVTFTGTVSTDGSLTYKRVGDERQDKTHLGPYDHVLAFKFVNHGHLDGIRFATSKATELTFKLAIAGQPAEIADVRIGAKNLHPGRVPFTITRTGIR